MKKIKKMLPILFLGFAFVTIIFSFRDNPFSKFLSGHDSSMFLYFGKGISSGLVPYRDMLDHKGPVLFMLEYLAVLIGLGNIHLGIWLIECIFLLGTLFFLYKSNCIYTRDKIISALTLLFLTPLFIICYEGGNLSEEYALLFISISFYLFSQIIVEKRISQVYYVLIGFLGAATFFIRLNMITVWGVYCLFLVYLGIKEKNFKQIFQQVRGIFLGGISFVLFIVLFSLYQGNFKEMIQQAFLMNILYADTLLSERIQTAFDFIDLLLRTGIFPIIIIYFISFLNIQNRTIKRTHIPIIIFLVLNFLTVILSGRFYKHYLTTEIASLSVIVSFSIQFILLNINGKIRRLVSLVLILIIALPAGYEALKNHNLSFSKYESANQQEIESLSKYIKKNSSVDDKIYVHNLDANIYLLSERYSNSRFFVIPAVNYDNFPELKREFKRDLNFKSPKFIVLSRDFSANPNASSNLNIFISEVIEEKYHLISPIKSENFLTYEINN